MRKSILCAIACMGLLSASAAPAPYPLTVNSRAQTAPPVLVYRANEAVFRVTFTDGDTASDLTGCTPFMSWATNAAALVNSTSSVSVVGLSTGLVDFTFSPSSVNYAAGRYVYEVGVLTSGGLPRVFRQGTFTIYDSPVGAGAGAIAWSTNVTWSSVAWIGLPDVTINGVVGNIKTSVVYTVTADSAQTAVVVTGVQSNLIATALQPADTNGWTVSAHEAWLTEETDAIALAALSTNVTKRIFTDDLSYYSDGTGAVWRSCAVWRLSSSGDIVTEYTTLPWPLTNYSDGVWQVTDADFGKKNVNYDGGIAFWSASDVETNALNFEMTSIDFPTIIKTLNYGYRIDLTGTVFNSGITVHSPRTDNPHAVTAAQVGAVATNAVRTAGCTDLGSATNLIVTGNTGAFLAYPAADYGVSVAAGSIFDGFSLTINSTNIPTYASNIYTQNAWTATARNILSFVPYTNGLWNVYGRGL